MSQSCRDKIVIEVDTPIAKHRGQRATRGKKNLTKVEKLEQSGKPIKNLAGQLLFHHNFYDLEEPRGRH